MKQHEQEDPSEGATGALALLASSDGIDDARLLCYRPVPLRGSARPKRIHTPHSATCNNQKKEDETIENGEFTVVQQRPKAGGKMGFEVSDRHFAGKNKGSRAGEESEEQKNAAEELKDAGNPQ